MIRNRRAPTTLLAIVLLAMFAFAACDDPERAEDGYILIFDYDGNSYPSSNYTKPLRTLATPSIITRAVRSSR